MTSHLPPYAIQRWSSRHLWLYVYTVPLRWNERRYVKQPPFRYAAICKSEEYGRVRRLKMIIFSVQVRSGGTRTKV